MTLKNDSAGEKPVRSTADLAARLGLSRWAVSRAINGRGGVSRETVERVRRAMGEHDFEPDPLARGLRGARTRSVGVCAPESSRAGGGLPLAGLGVLERKLRENGCRVWLELACGHPDREADAVRRFLGQRAEAVVLIRPQSGADSTACRLLRRAKAPCMAIDPQAGWPLPSARCDERQAADLVVGHLHGLGHRKLALLGLGAGSRRQAFQAACEARDISWRAQVRTFDEIDLDRQPSGAAALGWALAETMIRRRCAATAIVAGDDWLAFGAMRYLQETGRCVPGEFSIVGGGNLELAEYCAPTLTSVDAQFERLMERAADLLCEQMRAPGQLETDTILMNPLLVRRASTGAAPGDLPRPPSQQ
jgi:LacI family transcriptional regulator